MQLRQASIIRRGVRPSIVFPHRGSASFDRSRWARNGYVLGFVHDFVNRFAGEQEQEEV
jgi:hypothetical protein